jgi:phenylpropionate dioxygenase-like ring-hydroxylating dioxygenase large terminal subunit
VQESQAVIWVCLSEKMPGDPKKFPWFEHYAREGFQHNSRIQELHYDHSVVLENLMDPAHVPISHDLTDFSAKSEDASALVFEVTERTSRGFAGKWGRFSGPTPLTSTTRFEAPCCLQNDFKIVGKNGKVDYASAVFLCRPTGEGKSMVLV